MRRFSSWARGGLVAALVLAAAAGGCGSQRHAASQPPSIYAGLPLRGTDGEQAYERLGCAACHRVATVGNDGPGPRLTHIGSRLTKRELRRTLIDPVAPMPAYRNVSHAQMQALLAYLSRLR